MNGFDSDEYRDILNTVVSNGRVISDENGNLDPNDLEDEIWFEAAINRGLDDDQAKAMADHARQQHGG